jgi:hypothetical protein
MCLHHHHHTGQPKKFEYFAKKERERERERKKYLLYCSISRMTNTPCVEKIRGQQQIVLIHISYIIISHSSKILLFVLQKVSCWWASFVQRPRDRLINIISLYIQAIRTGQLKFEFSQKERERERFGDFSINFSKKKKILSCLFFVFVYFLLCVSERERERERFSDFFIWTT